MSQQACDHLSAVDPILAGVIERIGPLKPWRRSVGGLYGALARSVAGQQLSVKAAATIWGRVQAAHGTPKPQLWAEVPLTDFRACGLSQAKARSLIGMAQAFNDGSFPQRRISRLDDEAAIEALVTLPGIGRWSAEMVLMFHLQRPDVFSPGDAGLRRAMVELYGQDGWAFPGDYEAIISCWSPYRSTANRYLWAHLNNAPS
jgi:DNA-3-methyladenine glycosylase II